MNDKPKYNPQIHHRRSIRLKGYDYSQAGLYFITICCQERECRFGKIEVRADNNLPEMVLNDAGKIADECWMEIPKHFPNVKLHEHIVMPNHVHGIIELVDSVGAKNILPAQIVGVENFQPLQQQSNESSRNEFQKMIPRSIGSIVKGFKIGVTVRAKNILPDIKIWQRNYHEHIIRSEQSYNTISEYIINNPANWKEDKFFK